jgi:DNA repair exonuclease SbcCD ATPase subunit
MAMQASLRILVLACGGLVLWGDVAAEPAKGGGDAAVVQTLRKAQGMLRQLTQEKADLEARYTALETQLNQMKEQTEAQAKALKALEAKAAQLEPLQKELAQSKAGLQALQTTNTNLQQQLGGQTARLQTTAEQQRQTSGELARQRRDNLLLVNAVKERTRWIEDCAGKNKALAQANREMLGKFSDRSFWDDLKENEPFTGVGKIARENAVQDFQYKLDDLQVTPWQEPPANKPPSAGPAPTLEDATQGAQ